VSQAQKIIGAYIRAIREQKGLSQEALAMGAGISYQYLSGVETGKENFSIQVLESLSTALGLPLRHFMIHAFENRAFSNAPKLESRFWRDVPLPIDLTHDQLQNAFNRTQLMVHQINQNMLLELGQSLQTFIQGNNFSGLVSNLLSNAIDQSSDYKHNHHQRYPDLIHQNINEGLEVKTTINIGKGGESHNGHGGWHMITCYNFLANGDIVFVHIMFAQLIGHQHSNSDWSYLGSKVNQQTGSRRTETYTTNGQGTTKLRDGSVYLNTDVVNFSRWRQTRDGRPPSWSIFATK
jgi:transcriptional regulator with XRE-family HTH domain